MKDTPEGFGIGRRRPPQTDRQRAEAAVATGEARLQHGAGAERINGFVGGPGGRGNIDGEKVAITGFGAFWISRRPARKGINPATKQRIDLPAVNVPRFKPGKSLREVVKSLKLVKQA